MKHTCLMPQKAWTFELVHMKGDSRLLQRVNFWFRNECHGERYV